MASTISGGLNAPACPCIIYCACLLQQNVPSKHKGEESLKAFSVGKSLSSRGELRGQEAFATKELTIDFRFGIDFQC